MQRAETNAAEPSGRLHLGRNALPAARPGVARQRRRRGRSRRRHARRHRPQDAGAGARSGAHRRRAGGRLQEPFPRHHEPRIAHAAQRHHRLLRNDRAGRGTDAGCGAAQGICPADQRFRPASAVGGQRHSRHVEDGIRQFRDLAGTVRAACGAAQLLQSAGAEGAGKRHRSRDPRARGFAGHDRRSARVQADRAQSRLQCDQVHRARRQGDGFRCRRGIAAGASRRRYRRRHCRRRSQADRRSVLPGRQDLSAPARRHRPRAFDREKPGRPACRRDQCAKQDQRRNHRHRLAAVDVHATGRAAIEQYRNADAGGAIRDRQDQIHQVKKSA